MERHFWVSKAAQEHVQIVRDKGYTQVNMGPREPLENMHIGDWILYYSPTIYFEQDEPICEQFTGISCVTDNRIYPQSLLSPDKWRRNVEFFNCIPHHPKDFLNKVSFLQELENWMNIFKKPIFEIPREDFAIIANKIVVPDTKRILLF